MPKDSRIAVGVAASAQNDRETYGDRASTAWAPTGIDRVWPRVPDAPATLDDAFAARLPSGPISLGTMTFVTLWERVNNATVARPFAVDLSMPEARLLSWLVAEFVATIVRSPGFIVKLLGAAVEEIGRYLAEPLEATGAVRLTGIAYTFVPQAMAPLRAGRILRSEIKLPASAALDLLSAGGIAVILSGAIGTSDPPKAAIDLLSDAVLVIIFALGSVVLRWRVM